MDKSQLPGMLHQTLVNLGGKGTIHQVSKQFWNDYKTQLAKSDLLYTWQYDIRWAAHELRKNGTMKSAEVSKRGTWELI